MIRTENVIEVRRGTSDEEDPALREARYWRVRRAILEVLPGQDSGMTFDEMMRRIEHRLDRALFPDDRSLRWYSRVVQLDLETRGLVGRSRGRRTLEFHRTPEGDVEAGQAPEGRGQEPRERPETQSTTVPSP